MDYRAFELANDSCKPKHFAPPTALQKRLNYEAAHHLPAKTPAPPPRWRWLVGWFHNLWK
jgi:hypothetical protein